MIRLRAASLMAVILVAGCANANVPPPQAGPPWSWKEADRDGVPLSKGADECKYQAKVGARDSTGVSKMGDIEADLFDGCMRRRGY